MPSSAPWRNVTATWIPTDRIPLFRRLAYALPHRSIARTTVAMTARGAFLRCPDGVEAIPLGTFFVEIHPGLYVPAGYEVTPAVAPDVLYRALGAPASQMLFVTTDATALAVDAAAFIPLETALLEAPAFEPAVADAIESALATAPVELKLAPLGAFPLRGAEAPEPVPLPGNALPKET
jgi:hypothetical protein